MHQFIHGRLADRTQHRGSSAHEGGAAPRPDDYSEVAGALDLAGWGRVFLGRPGPRLLAGAATAVVARRARLGRWRAEDAAVAAAVVGLHPFAEWAVHVYILHGPNRRAGRKEGFSARKHRQHHEDPQAIDLVLLPLPTVLGLVGAAVLPAWVAPDRRRGATGSATSLLMLLIYEWVHFLIHSPYKPRRALYRARWRAHRLHHYRNENYWFGVVGTIADRVLGTAPAKGDVPLSGSARTLAAPGPGGSQTTRCKADQPTMNGVQQQGMELPKRRP